MAIRLVLPKEATNQVSKKPSLMRRSTLRKPWEQLVEEVSPPHSKYGVAVYYIIASSEASSNLGKRFDGTAMVVRRRQEFDDIYVNTRSQGALVMKSNVKMYHALEPFSLSSWLLRCLLQESWSGSCLLIIQDFEKVFADYDHPPWSNSSKRVILWFDSLNHDPARHVLGGLVDHSS